ncbi:hypothetical protein [Oscillatoria acuminata]|nr:hypothetical protein [Oscillatoria acuminata]
MDLASYRRDRLMRVRYVAIAPEEPHPNPPLAKGRGPEVQLIVKD